VKDGGDEWLRRILGLVINTLAQVAHIPVPAEVCTQDPAVGCTPAREAAFTQGLEVGSIQDQGVGFIPVLVEDCTPTQEVDSTAELEEVCIQDHVMNRIAAIYRLGLFSLSILRNMGGRI
jgi:hypothetical protein